MHKKKSYHNKRAAEQLADLMTALFGTITFLLLNALFFFGWIAINLGFVPGLQPFDTFPFGFLTMVVSLEAIFLANIVLISQNRAARIAELREEVDFQVDLEAEKEITKILQILDQLQRRLDITNVDDPELEAMKRALDLKLIERRAQTATAARKKDA